MSETTELRSHEAPKPGTARQQLDQLYRAIGIQAVAAAAAQVARADAKPEKAERELPFFLRDDRDAA